MLLDIFTLKPIVTSITHHAHPSSAKRQRCTASPALFNRCVVDWFGTWSGPALAQVAYEFTMMIDTGFTNFSPPNLANTAGNKSSSSSSSSSSAIRGQHQSSNSSHEEHEENELDPIAVLAMVVAAVMPVNSDQQVTITLSEAIVAALICLHRTAIYLARQKGKGSGKPHYLSPRYPHACISTTSPYQLPILTSHTNSSTHPCHTDTNTIDSSLPRDFLDLIRQFVKVEAEKRSFLEEQQTHIRAGLQKLLETQDQVTLLRSEMMLKDDHLQQKDAEANEKLSRMVSQQNEAESRKRLAEELTLELSRQNEEIRVRRETVERELSEAEPALVSAKQCVQNIRKSQLDEVRQLARPPNAVRLTLEMVSIMIGEKNMEWTEIRKVIRREDFIATVVNFDPLSLTAKQVKDVQENYLSQNDLDYASVDRASKACGPLYQWAESQITYATILRRVKPLRDEVTCLTEKSLLLEQRQKEAVEQVEQLTASIQRYKMEYATAIRACEAIRLERDVVNKKAVRAEALLSSLEQEKDRWNRTSEAFDRQMSTLIGDALLAGAFLTYCGAFDHRMRRELLAEWSLALDSLHVPSQPDLNIVSFLTQPSEQLQWSSCGLPNDELTTQNAMLLARFNRYPLIVDPSGQATAFILSKFSSSKITQTSFLDAAFLKTLASAIRFGSPIIVHDVESLDPILNPVLNKEIQKTGGRSLIRLGSEDIDFSPKFLIFLVTRNPSAHFAPDLCSRVTLINFTATPASLEAQALGAILKAERPEVDARRSEMLRLQSIQSVKLRELEETLLNKISAVQGKILDDDSVIHSLEQIQAEAFQLQSEVTITERMLDEVKGVSVLYEPLARAMAAVYFSLDQMSDMCPLYQFSLSFVLDIINRVLSKCPPPVVSGGAVAATSAQTHTHTLARIRELSDSFFCEVSRRVLHSLKSDDQLLFVVRLAQIATQGDATKELQQAEFDVLLGAAIGPTDSLTALTACQLTLDTWVLDQHHAKQLLALTALPVFSTLVAAMKAEAKAWAGFYAHDEPEMTIPLGWVISATSTSTDKSNSNAMLKVTPERVALLKVLLVRAFRPERLHQALELYVTAVFGGKHVSQSGERESLPPSEEGNQFPWREHARLSLRSIVLEDSRGGSPILLCSEPGHDASSKVDALALALDRSMLAVAMGSNEGYGEADRSLAQAAKTGAWVLLRNVHLCHEEWLSSLAKRLYTLTPHDGFRLFLTSDMNCPTLPAALLRLSEVIAVEATSGLKAGLQRFFSSIPASRIDRAPMERCRLYCLLAWLNALVQARLRYTPLGWTKHYEFSEADAACALDMIDAWIDHTSGAGAGSAARTHVSPEELPWDVLRTLLSQSVYGGRIDRSTDQAVLDAFIDATFRPENYLARACIARDHHGHPLVTLPDGLNRVAFEQWINALPDTHSPAWLGLPVLAETHRHRIAGQRLLARWGVFQGIADEANGPEVKQPPPRGESKSLDVSATAATSSSSSHGLSAVLEMSTKLLDVLPNSDFSPTAGGSARSKVEWADDQEGVSLASAVLADGRSSSLQRCLARELMAGATAVATVHRDLENVR